VVVWVVADATVNGSETGTSFRQALYFKECGFNLHDTMIYEKAGTGACGSNLAYWQTWEYMFVFSKGRPSVVNRQLQKNSAVGAKVCGKRNNTAEGGRTETKPERVCQEYGVRPNIWRYNTNKFGMESEWKHPAKFPVKLAEDHILSWSNPGDTVLDPFLGSGTTGKMAIETGREFIGIEISEEYLKIAQTRIGEAQIQKAIREYESAVI
jgi:site-specific DNA-methyltransferase (adenine-specific)